MKALDAKISRVIILCLVFISPSNAFYKNSNFDMNNSTCPKTFIPLPNSYSLIDYINSRQTCTQACNNAGYCCTKGAGGCNNVPCTEGCHIAWFSEDLEACKAQCRIANDAPDCVYTWNHEKIGEAGFNPFYQFGTGVVKCFGSDSCGCPVGFGFGSSNDCGSHACEAGCEFAHSLELRNLFFHGETVNVDEHVNGDMQALLATINTLSAYVQNSLEFNKTQIQQTMMDFDKGSAFLETEFHLMEAALDLVDDYEVRHGPLFLSSKTINGIPKTDTQDDGLDLERAMLQIQQTILDEIYHATLPTLAYQTRLYSSVISECASFLWGRKWQTSRFFPGYVDPPSNSSTVYNVTIKATNPKSWGRPVCFDEDPKIRTTGLYLPPGEIAFVSVPEFIIGKKYTIRVGAANADHQNKNVNKRMNRVTCNYDINNSTVAIASPLGGGIYIMVPFMADEGIVQISITGGVVQAPIYSNTSVYTTSEQEWESLRITPSPWADFETDLFLLNVPRSWMYNYNYAHIQQLVEDYHSSMEGILELKGYPVDKRNDHVLYIQADITIRHGTFGVGYPQINNLVHSGPDGPVTAGHHSLPGLSTHWLIAEGPFSENSDVCFHELGHCQITSMYRGEHEAIVNLYHAYIRNVKDNLDLDIAFSESLERDGNWSIDNAAISWMVTENFRQGNNMDHTNTQRDEFRYQHRGYAKYVDIARLFGWQVLINFFYQENLHYRSYGNNNSIEGLSVTDDRTLRLSMAAGYDLSLLIRKFFIVCFLCSL